MQMPLAWARRKPGCRPSWICRESTMSPGASRPGGSQPPTMARAAAVAARTVAIDASRTSRLIMMKRRIEAADDRVAVDRLAEEAYGSRGLGSPANPFLRESRNEDDGDAAVTCVQLGLQIQSAHARHLDIDDQARRVMQAGRCQEVLGGREDAGAIAERT